MTEAQKCLYHIAENMRMDKSISKEGYEYFQQAIKALEQEPQTDEIILSKKEYRELLSDEFEHGYDKGLSDAITSLEQEPCEDCVSREQLNKLYNKYRPFLATRVCEFGEKLKELPSVQPVATDNNVLTCEDCISRQAAIDCLNADFTIDGKENMETVVDYITGAFKQIKALPPVTPQQKVGQWIYDKTIENWRCSECNETPKIMGYVGTADFMAEHFRFCNHCGTKMEVVRK